MDDRARAALEKLLAAGNRSAAGVTTRAPSVTASLLSDYRKSPSLQSKEAFETSMRDARAQGAIELVWDDFTEHGFIERIKLVDIGKLAEFLGQITAAGFLESARILLREHFGRYPVFGEVFQRWSQLKKVRGLGPEDALDWLDAARVVDYARAKMEVEKVDMPLRVASARLFNDSKRIEGLCMPIDILLVGDLEAGIREVTDIWQELGLFREEQPIRLAGRVVVRRERITALLDTPYTALAATTIKELESIPDMVLSIENQTNFHMEARARCEENILLIYSAGMPSPAWRAAYSALLASLPSSVPVHHWGDVDEGGFRIAARIAKEAALSGHMLQPWRMDPNDVPLERRRPATQSTINRMAHFALTAGWVELAKEVSASSFTVEQEGLA